LSRFNWVKAEINTRYIVEALAGAVNALRRSPVHVVPALADLPAAVAALARAGDLVLTLGAGSIAGVAARLVAALEARPAGKAGV
jgi:UDP-N-acetylmuramate--alanine ligase